MVVELQMFGTDTSRKNPGSPARFHAKLETRLE